MSNYKFRWIHFSDLHVGSAGQNNLWSKFEHDLRDDLDKMLSTIGHIDLVVFSGDLVQKGSVDEFIEFDKILNRIMDQIAEKQSHKPPVITVPGNHDLARPNQFDPESMLLKQYWDNHELRRHIWSDIENKYITYIRNMFNAYQEWVDQSISAGVHLKPVSPGVLPGDASYVLARGDLRLGIVCLNSTWLQISEGNFDGKLHVDVKQIHESTNNDPGTWVRKNDANLLVTHQPDSWLHTSDFDGEWANDINPAGLFDAHLFGHMHTSQLTSVSYGGQVGLIKQQAAALLGLEYLGDGKAERIQGYNFCEIDFSAAERIITTWPRKLHRVVGGRRVMGRNADIAPLDEATGSFANKYILGWQSNRQAGRAVAHRSENLRQPAGDDKKEDDSTRGRALFDRKFELNDILYLLGDTLAHANVRRIDQFRCVEALRRARAVWLESDWDLGENGFIATTLPELQIPLSAVFSITIDAYTSRDDLLLHVQNRYGAGINTICDALNKLDSAALIVRVSDGVGQSIFGRHIERDLEKIIGIVLDYAPKVKIFICVHKSPTLTGLPTVRLRQLDEADTAVYIKDHSLGGGRYSTPDLVDKLFRYTDGVPTHLDSVLRDLEIESLPSILASNSDITDQSSFHEPLPSPTIDKLRALRKSTKEDEKRAYRLLLALSALPQGEKLERIRHFLGVHPFMRPHARMLIDRGLIYPSSLVSLSEDRDSGSPLLIVSRSVRDYVRDLLDDDTRSQNDELALNLYFGSEWRSGNLKKAPICSRLRSANCDDFEMQNAITLILRHVRRQLEIGDLRTKDNAIRLAITFIRLLNDGEHYRSCAIICEDLSRLLKERSEYPEKIAAIEVQFASSLRLMGRTVVAREVLADCDVKILTKSQQQEAELELAFCSSSLGDPENVATSAKRVVALDQSSSWALFARMLLADLLPDRARQQRELRKLIVIARGRNNKTLLNTLLINLAKSYGGQDERSVPLLQSVLSDATHKDQFYNSVRAQVEILANLGPSEKISEAQKRHMIDAYHYCHKERLVNLLNKCHKILWRRFLSDGDTENLLNLFRKSSFFWRVSHQQDIEQSYLKLLGDHIALTQTPLQISSNENHQYYAMRSDAN